MKFNKTILTAVLGLTMSTLSSQAAQINILDVLNLTGIGGPNTPLNTNSGGGNQHQGSNNPVFSFNGDLPRITVQRSSMGTKGNYLVIYQGAVIKNQPPPAGVVQLTGSYSSLANPPDFNIDFGSLSAVATQICALLLASPTATWTIATIENTGGSNAKTDDSFQFNFPNLKVVNGALTPTINISTQVGHNG
jgi:hypothetical protein